MKQLLNISKLVEPVVSIPQIILQEAQEQFWGSSLDEWMRGNLLKETVELLPACLNHFIAKPVGEHLWR